MTRLGVPRRTAALIGANSLSAAVQGQFQFVLPWMLLTRGHSPQVAAFAAGLVYAPLLITAVPAGAASDNVDPRRLMRIATVLTLGACLLYPAAAFAGYDVFAFVLVAAVVVGSVRNFGEGALFRGIGDTTRGPTLLRAHALRTTVNQAAVFGSPFVGLLLFRAGGVDAMMIGICVLLVVAIGILGLVPELERGSESAAAMRKNVVDGVASLRGNDRLRAMGWVNLTWNLFAGAAMGIMPAVLHEHLGMDEARASVTFIAGAAVVVVLTLPVVRTVQSRVGAVSTFIVAITVQGVRRDPLCGRPRRDSRAAHLLPVPALEQRRGSVSQRSTGRGGGARSPGAPQHGPDDRRDDRIHRGRAHGSGPDRAARLRRRAPDHRHRAWPSPPCASVVLSLAA